MFGKVRLLSTTNWFIVIKLQNGYFRPNMAKKSYLLNKISYIRFNELSTGRSLLFSCESLYIIIGAHKSPVAEKVDVFKKPTEHIILSKTKLRE